MQTTKRQKNKEKYPLIPTFGLLIVQMNLLIFSRIANELKLSENTHRKLNLNNFIYEHSVEKSER